MPRTSSGKTSYQGASRSYDEVKTVRVPVIGDILFRGTDASKDQRYVNGFFDVFKNPISGQSHFYYVKRPGLTRTNGIQPSGTTGTGRGVYSWNAKKYSVINAKIYSGTTDLGVTLAGTTGLVGFAETRPGASPQYLCINDGIKLYCIATNDVVTTVTLNFPSPNTTDLVYMDGYFFVVQASNSTVYQSNLDDPTTWDVTKFITAQQYNGPAVGLAHQNNILIVFQDRATAMYYDNANPSGSVLNLYEQAVQQIGCISQDTISTAEQSILWVGNSNTGGYCVWRLDGIGTLTNISSPALERLLSNEGTSIGSCYAFSIRAAGKFFYALSIVSAGRTFIYDYDQNIWTEWEAAAGGAVWPIVSSTQHLNTVLCQHATNGWLYTLTPAVFQDDSVNFTVLWRTSRIDFETNQRKFYREASIIGDIQSSTTNTLLQYSDDDYVTLSTARTLDLSIPHPFCNNLGNSRRRSWQLSYTGTNPWRVEALEFRVRVIS